MLTSAKLLVVDDDERLRDLLKAYLQEEGFHITVAQHAEAARKLMQSHQYDLIILDVMMPGVSGLEFAEELKKSAAPPILMLTALGDPQDRIKGLEQGVEDYLVKPFEPRELVLRIERILQRNAGKPMKSKLVSFGDYVFDMEDSALLKNGEVVKLSSTERKIMRIFASNIGLGISREDLSAALNHISERSVDVHVTRLRKKIETDPKNPRHLQSMRGTGYVLRKK